jgi:hypothetical protein
MKRGTPDKTKLRQLCRELGLPQYAGVGLLELLWHRTANEAPRGDIGKLSNEDLALALDWQGDADELVAALVKWRWLDRHDVHRLVVHNWPKHCEDSIHLKLARARDWFADGTVPRLHRLSKAEREPIAAFYTRAASARTADPSARTADPSAQMALPCALPTPTPTPTPMCSSSERVPRRNVVQEIQSAGLRARKVSGGPIEVELGKRPDDDSSELETLKGYIREHAQLTTGYGGGEDPPEEVVRDTLRAARGLNARQILREHLDPLRRDGHGPTESWRWYPKVIRDRVKR